MPTTHTIMSNSHFPEEIGLEVIKDTVQGNVINYTAKRGGCSHQTVFDMRHKFLLALQQLPDASEVCLGGVSEFDETFVLDCYKGKGLDSPSTRKPRKYGVKAEKRGFPVNMCVSVQVSSVKGMPLRSPSTGQSPARGNWSAYLKGISPTGHLRCVAD